MANISKAAMMTIISSLGIACLTSTLVVVAEDTNYHERSLDFINILAPGECIVSGTAFQTPAFIYVLRVNEGQRPKSEDVILTGKSGLFTKKSATPQFWFSHTLFYLVIFIIIYRDLKLL